MTTDFDVDKMYVVKRDGRKEEVQFDKITKRIDQLCFGLNKKYINATRIAQKVIASIHDGITTQELDMVTVRIVTLMMSHYDLRILAGRIAASNIQKNAPARFSEAVDLLYNYFNKSLGRQCNIVGKEFYDIVMAHRELFDMAIIPENDFQYNIFSIETLKKSYLLTLDGAILETPQYMLMRTAIQQHGHDVENVIKTYREMSNLKYTHSSPTLFNSGTKLPQLASCFLICMFEDSINGIYLTLHECAMISKAGGGIGLAFQSIRSEGSYIESSNAESSGIVPFLKVYETTGKCVDQGRRRKGAIAVYMEPHHPDFFKFLDLRKQSGNPELRTPDLFTAVWISNYFFECVQNDETWYFLDPNICPGLDEVYGDEYVALYKKYVDDGKSCKNAPARQVMALIAGAMIETGTPYIVNKDECNRKSNQKNLGTIKSSNLCAEIVQYSSPEETAVCNLGSINLSQCVVDGKFDFDSLVDITRTAIFNLDKVIDVTFYPTERSSRSNLRHRPLGLGVSGLQDVFHMLRLPFDSIEAKDLNKKIFETLYRGAVLESIELAKQHGPYESFPGSPASQGILQFDMWDIDQSTLFWDDWSDIKAEVVKHGLRNSQLIALMPTASSATIMGVTESFEIQTSNIFSRKVLSGEFVVINKYLIDELDNSDSWNNDMLSKIIDTKGSIQSIPEISSDTKAIFKTVWEHKMRTVIDMAADRGPFICQSQSLNMFLSDPTVQQVISMLLYSHSKGLKTLSYYLHTRSASNAINFNSCLNCSA